MSNSELAKAILLQVEKVDPESLYKVSEIDGYPDKAIVAEMYQMIEEELIEATPLYSQASTRPTDYQDIYLKQKGREFLRKKREEI